MPERTPDQHRPEPDVLTEQLTMLATDTARTSELAEPADLRRRAVRRRAGRVTVVAAATALAIGIGWAVAAPSQERADDDLQPVGTPSPTDVTTIHTADPSTARDESRTAQEYDPSAPTVPPPASPGARPVGGWVTTFPADFTLPFEGVKSTDSETSDWATLPGVDSWLLQPCDSTAETGYPSDDARTDFRSIGYHTIEYAESEQLALYASDEGAIAAMDELRRSLTRCSAERTLNEKDGYYTDSYWDWTDADVLAFARPEAPNESFVAWNWNRTYDLRGQPQYGLGGGYFMVSRVGNAIFLTVSDGETDYAQPSQVEAAERYTRTTRSFLPTLCATFADGDGC